MKIALICAAATVSVLVCLFWLMTQIHYRIGSRHLKITIWGLAIRKIALNTITKVSKRRPRGAAEYWYNTLKPSHRFLAVERTSGLRKFICISPSHRYVFMADLKAAVRRVNPEADLREFSDGPEHPQQPAPYEKIVT